MRREGSNVFGRQAKQRLEGTRERRGMTEPEIERASRAVIAGPIRDALPARGLARLTLRILRLTSNVCIAIGKEDSVPELAVCLASVPARRRRLAVAHARALLLNFPI
jgi:hypothetical protein